MHPKIVGLNSGEENGCVLCETVCYEGTVRQLVGEIRGYYRGQNRG